MKSMQQIGLTILAGAIALGVSAQEQDKAQGHLLVKTVVQKQAVVVDANGRQKVELVDAKTVIPGDEVVYTVTFENISDQPAENVVITNPLAENLVYVDGSAYGPGSDIVFSVDGGNLFAHASDLSVSENGAVRPAEPGDFTHIRWQMQGEIPAGSQGVARFRAKLE